MFRDGTLSYRNPTAEELATTIESGKVTGPCAELLAHFHETYTRPDFDISQGRDNLDANLVNEGLPGHWVSTAITGHRTARVPAPPAPAAPEPKEEEEAAEGEEAPAADDAEAGDGEGLEIESPEPTLADFLGGQLSEDGSHVEYGLEPISCAFQKDPHTLQMIRTSSNSVMVFENEEETEKVVMFHDGTRMFSTKNSHGFKLVVEKAGVSKVTVTNATENLHEPYGKVVVNCPEGTILEVDPLHLSTTGDFMPAHPHQNHATNAQVILRRTDGTVIRSRGNGEVWILSQELKKTFLKKIFGYEARCEFWVKIGLRFWILVGYVDFLAKFGAKLSFRV